MHEYADGARMMAQMQGKKGAPPVPVLPTNPPEFHMAKDGDDGAALVSFAKGVDGAFDKDDAEAVGAIMTDDADYWLNFTGMPASHGKKQLVKELDGFFHAFPDQKWTETNVWGIDGFALVEHCSMATTLQEGPKLRPRSAERTGKTVSGVAPARHHAEAAQPARIQRWLELHERPREMMAQSEAAAESQVRSHRGRPTKTLGQDRPSGVAGRAAQVVRRC